MAFSESDYVPLALYAGAALAFYVGCAVAIHRGRLHPGGHVHMALLVFSGAFTYRFASVLDRLVGGQEDLGSGAVAAPPPLTLRGEAEFLLAFISSLSVGLVLATCCFQAMVTRGAVGPRA